LTSGDERVEDLLARADQGLYRAKNEGRDRVAAYGHEHRSIAMAPWSPAAKQA
jgi:hypothetical protein